VKPTIQSHLLPRFRTLGTALPLSTSKSYIWTILSALVETLSLMHPAAIRAVENSWNVMAHSQKSDFVFRRSGRVHLNRRCLQFSRLLAADVRASAVVMLDTRCSEVVWRVLATHSIRQLPLHFPSRASSCAITFQLEFSKYSWKSQYVSLWPQRLPFHKVHSTVPTLYQA
jgi:hypothetical protein